MNFTRIEALVIRHLYLYKRSVPRLMEILYWPMLDLVLWGFITMYLSEFKQNLPNFVTFLLGAMILWDILFRSQQGISISFLEEIWSRNLINLFVSPLTISEYLTANIIVSILKVFSAGILLIAGAQLLFGFNMFVMGSSLFILFFNLIIMGWAIGIVTISLILRFGEEAEVMAWGFPFIFQPISAVFYPVSVLPEYLRYVAYFVPAAHTFEGMRQVVNDGTFPLKHMIIAFVLNIIYMALSWLLFSKVFEQAKEKGFLVKRGT